MSKSLAVLTGEDDDSLRVRCPASAHLTASQFAELAALPSVVGPVQRTVTCELAAGHDGDHLAFTVAAEDGEHWWWLYWADHHHSLIQVDTCASVNGPHRDECLLAKDHAGPHSFDIRATCTTAKVPH